MDDTLDALHRRRDYAGLSLAGADMVRPILAKMVRAGSIPGMDEDLIGVGNLAVCEAVRTWTPSRAAFSTHIRHTVRYAVLNYCAKEVNKGIGGRHRKGRSQASFVYLDHIILEPEAQYEE